MGLILPGSASPGKCDYRPDEAGLTAFLCLSDVTGEDEEDEADGRKPPMQVRRNFSHFSRNLDGIKMSKISARLQNQKNQDFGFKNKNRFPKKNHSNDFEIQFFDEFEQNILVGLEKPN